MPTNANTFNSRVTSEALEAKFRQTFPAQGGAELVQDLFASGVIQPIVDFTAVAEGSALRSDLQTAWDFSTGFNSVTNTTTTIITNTGFWQIGLNAVIDLSAAGGKNIILKLNDGLGTKRIWSWTEDLNSPAQIESQITDKLICFVRSGDSVQMEVSSSCRCDIWYRQIADVYGNLTQPLGYTSS